MIDLLSWERALILLVISHTELISFVPFFCLFHSEDIRTKSISFLLDQLQFFVQVGLDEFIHILFLLFLFIDQFDKSLIKKHR